MNQQKNVEERSLDAVKVSRAFVIKTNEQNLEAAKRLKVVQLLQKEVSETFDPIIDKCHKAHKEACAQKNKFFIPLKYAEKEYKNKLEMFDNEQEIIRLKEESKLREQAEVKENKLKERAAEALENGDEKKAEKLIEKAAEIPIPTVAPKFEKPKTVSFSTHYRGIIVDEKLIPRTLNGIVLLIPDSKVINKLIHDSKGTIVIPGSGYIRKNR